MRRLTAIYRKLQITISGKDFIPLAWQRAYPAFYELLLLPASLHAGSLNPTDYTSWLGRSTLSINNLVVRLYIFPVRFLTTCYILILMYFGPRNSFPQFISYVGVVLTAIVVMTRVVRGAQKRFPSSMGISQR